jgi:hypothetical protein
MINAFRIVAIGRSGRPQPCVPGAADRHDSRRLIEGMDRGDNDAMIERKSAGVHVVDEVSGKPLHIPQRLAAARVPDRAGAGGLEKVDDFLKLSNHDQTPSCLLRFCHC